MRQIKHVGKIKNTGAKVVVVFRTIPGESDHALVLPTHNLPDSYHDSLMTVIESEQAQDVFEFGELMFSRPFPDGRPMLEAMQVDGRLQKFPTDAIVMTPTPNAEIRLDQLNVMIAEQKNCAVDELCNFVSGARPVPKTEKPVIEPQKLEVVEEVTPATQENIALSDQDLAKSYRSQADAMYKEAARLRREADAIDPPKKKTAKVEDKVS
jgi:hypothetical protein